MSTAIKVENLSKAYQLGEIGTGTLSNDLKRWAYKVRGKEDPFLKIGETNDRTTKGESDMVWSLKDINFEIEQGDAVGIIGRNGAGKSTLLKILSRVTSPTTGSVKIKGRVASLLEVGTGFHPELTGRENIFLNGAILGMRKAEIKKHFDAIVDFSGVERYIDTPVKRYSSGMYVRLAFAVAAHLESEILIVDEVLAVGDAEFQKKCLGKMNDVSKGEGKTVLFVSHNMDAITRLCSNSIFLKMGMIENIGATDKIISRYLHSDFGTMASRKWENKREAPGNDFVRLIEVNVIDANHKIVDSIDIRKPVFIEAKYEILKDGENYTHGLNLFNETGVHVFSSHDKNFEGIIKPSKKGIFITKIKIPDNFLAEGMYRISFAIMSYEPYIIHLHEMDIVGFLVKDTIDGDSARGGYGGNYPGVIRPILEWIN
jgi:lipopolysaccharide transport system ATP-binding protein